MRYCKKEKQITILCGCLFENKTFLVITHIFRTYSSFMSNLHKLKVK